MAAAEPWQDKLLTFSRAAPGMCGAAMSAQFTKLILLSLLELHCAQQHNVCMLPFGDVAHQL
jgi:hypothetical protein